MFNNWNLMRAARLLLGVILVIMGVQEQSWFIVAAGGLYTLMPLLNIGCCAIVPAVRGNKSSEDERPIIYEEVR